MPEITDDEMDARLHDAGARWRAATPVPTLAAADPTEVDIVPTSAATPHRRRTWFAALTGAAVVAAAVMIGVAVTRGDNGTPQPAGQPELAGTSWQLAEVGTSGNGPFVAAGGAKGAALDFSADGKVSGSDGCNTFSGPVDIRSSTLSFGNLAITEMGCPGSQASAALIDRVVVGDVGWAISDGRLVLTKAGVGSIVYAAKAAPTTSTDPAKLVGVTWGLSGIEHDTGNSASGSGSSDTAAITLTFDNKGGFAVDGQCNFRGRVVVGAGVATFPASDLVRSSCPPGSQGVEGVAVGQALIGATTWSIADGTLTIAKGSTKLTFTDHPSADQPAPSSPAGDSTALRGTSWLLADINSPKFRQTLDPSKTKLKLTIDQAGSLSVDDGVNFHSVPNDAPVAITDTTITLTGLASTAAGCAPTGTGPNPCTRSGVISDFFGGTISWAIRSDHLALTKGDTTLVYVRG